MKDIVLCLLGIAIGCAILYYFQCVLPMRRLRNEYLRKFDREQKIWDAQMEEILSRTKKRIPSPAPKESDL